MFSLLKKKLNTEIYFLTCLIKFLPVFLPVETVRENAMWEQKEPFQQEDGQGESVPNPRAICCWFQGDLEL